MTQEEIGKWLEGENQDLNYLVSIETDETKNSASCIFHYPNGEKELKEINYYPFIWCKDIKSLNLYEGNNSLRDKNAVKYGVAFIDVQNKINYSIYPLRVDNEDRLKYGYRYLVKTTKSYKDLLKFFIDGGVQVKGRDRESFFQLKLEEQFLIQKRTRFFKGYELYSDIHKLYFDIETTGLNPKIDKIFFIGLKDNKGYEKILVNKDVSSANAEALLICEFFEEINKIKPAIIAGYNSEKFDFPFIHQKLKEYDLIGRIPTTLSKSYGHLKSIDYKTTKGSLKMGGEKEEYEKSVLWGVTTSDVWFSVRRAKAINSEIKSTKLKYITKFYGLNKPDRMYHKPIYGSIYEYYKNNKNFIIDRLNNNYKLIPEKYQNNPEVFKELFIKKYKDELVDISKIEIITGSEIIYQYLLDDLWETERVDESVNQETFMVTKLLPLTFSKKLTMGNAAMWNLLMSAWSYDNKLAIPNKTKKVNFTGGLSRVFKLGFLENIQKNDYAGLYPSIKLAHNVFPKSDITGAIKMFLQYFVDTRNIYKAKKKKAEDEKNEKEEKYWDLKQLPLKIFNNSNFGAEGSEYFNWAEMDVAETVTCIGRQYLRKMVYFFYEYGLVPLVLDTDGCNFSVPTHTFCDIENNKLTTPIMIESLEYQGAKGVPALIKKFNSSLKKPIKVDDDGQWIAAINVSAKNYINKVSDKKIKFVGNTVKSTKLPEYVNNFIDVGSSLLLSKKPKEFIEMYYDIVSKLINREIPAMQLLSKANVKSTLLDYVCRAKNKKGQLLPKQAHMELILRDILPIEIVIDIEEKRKIITDSKSYRNYVEKILEKYNNPYNIGNTIYYINTGERKGNGDSNTDKEGNMFSMMIKNIETSEDILIDYNILKYLDSFIKRVSKLFIVFKDEISKELKKPFKITKKNKQSIVTINKIEFADSDITLINKDKNTIEELMTMELKEIKYWLNLEKNSSLKDRIGNIRAKDIFPYFTLPDFTTSSKKVTKKKEDNVVIVTAKDYEIYNTMFYGDIEYLDVLEYEPIVDKSDLIFITTKNGIKTHIPKKFVIIVDRKEVDDVIFTMKYGEKIKELDEIADLM